VARKPTQPTLATRKPIDKLTPNDLVVFPIWEFASGEEQVEEQDETWVRPVDAKVVRKGSYSLSVAADFRTASGLIIPGIVGVSTDDGVELDHGVLLHDGKYVFVQHGNAREKSKTARELGLTAKVVFPMSFTLRVRIGREKELRVGSYG
jgi:hypothetical protein